MNYIIDHESPKLNSTSIIVCEGMGDANLVNSLLIHHQISICQVGCPSQQTVRGMGKDKISEYLQLVQTLSALQHTKLERIMVVGDADTTNQNAFLELSRAMIDAGLPAPSASFSIEDRKIGNEKIKVGIYVIPGKGRDGTLEHLLLEAAYEQNPGREQCIDTFLACAGSVPTGKPNKEAKRRMSALAGAVCSSNPWTSLAYIWSDPSNPISIQSRCFNPIADFIRLFLA